MAGMFYKLGRMAGPSVRKGKWIWQSLTGDESEILEAEHEVGADLAASMRDRLGDDPDAALRRRVEAVGDALRPCVKNKQRRFAFYVIRGEEPNAFALPGGHVFVNRPLMELLEKTGAEDGQLAFILGHEMGHVIKKHPMERLVSDTALGAAMNRLRVPGPAAQWLKSTGFKLMQSAYSQDRELIADKLGARLAQAAGYDGAAAIRMLRQLRDLGRREDGPPLGEYFSTHPPFDERIRELRRTVEKQQPAEPG